MHSLNAIRGSLAAILVAAAPVLAADGIESRTVRFTKGANATTSGRSR